MEEKTTMEITNDRLEEAIKDYAADRTKEKLTAVLNLLRPTKLLVPAMLKAPDQPTPCYLKSGAGELYFVVYTSKEQMANAPKSQALLSMPFPACNSVAVKPELNLSGMVINPFTDNLVLKIELIQKLHEADEKMAKQIDDETMENVCILAKHSLTEEEKEKAKKDMQEMLDYVDKLDELDTSSVEPMSHIFGDNNVFREDVVTNGDDRDNMLKNAPAEKDGTYKVPRTVE